MPEPKAVLLDVGGVLLLPLHDRIAGALQRGGFTADAGMLDRAHYAGAAALTEEAVALGWPDFWRHYLDAYITECGVPDEMRDEVHQHLDSEFATGMLWSRIAPGARDGLRALVESGVRLGIVSNAEGTVEQQLREAGLVQVGAGAGVEVECVIDSTVVGVAKPDPRIFHIALDAMGIEPADAWYVGDTPCIDVTGAAAAGLRPLLFDPYRFNEGGGHDRVGSLREVAQQIGNEVGPAQER